jgi:hypothetical protein
MLIYHHFFFILVLTSLIPGIMLRGRAFFSQCKKSEDIVNVFLYMKR